MGVSVVYVFEVKTDREEIKTTGKRLHREEESEQTCVYTKDEYLNPLDVGI